jgi:hypothetical protein
MTSAAPDEVLGAAAAVVHHYLRDEKEHFQQCREHPHIYHDLQRLSDWLDRLKGAGGLEGATAELILRLLHGHSRYSATLDCDDPNDCGRLAFIAKVLKQVITEIAALERDHYGDEAANASLARLVQGAARGQAAVMALAILAASADGDRADHGLANAMLALTWGGERDPERLATAERVVSAVADKVAERIGAMRGSSAAAKFRARLGRQETR